MYPQTKVLKKASIEIWEILMELKDELSEKDADVEFEYGVAHDHILCVLDRIYQNEKQSKGGVLHE
jgi:hypothetical protein